MANELAKDTRTLPLFVSSDDVILLDEPPSRLRPILFVGTTGLSYPRKVCIDTVSEDFG